MSYSGRFIVTIRDIDTNYEESFLVSTLDRGLEAAQVNFLSTLTSLVGKAKGFTEVASMKPFTDTNKE